MALRSETLTLLSLSAVVNANQQLQGIGGGFDLSGYADVTITANTSVFGTGWTPSFWFSEDQGATWTSLPTGLMAAPAQIVANGVVVYPWVPTRYAFPGRIRIGYAIASTAVTATVRAIGRY